MPVDPVYRSLMLHETIEEVLHDDIGLFGQRHYGADVLIWSNDDDASLLPVDASRLVDLAETEAVALLVCEDFLVVLNAVSAFVR